MQIILLPCSLVLIIMIIFVILVEMIKNTTLRFLLKKTLLIKKHLKHIK